MNRSDWNRQVNRQRDVLERILALLFLLAGLADRAASEPGHRRRHALAILACAEAEARALVVGLAGAPVEGGVAPRGCASAADAEHLAAGFRVLALVLGAMLAQACRPALTGDVGRQALLPVPQRSPVGLVPARLPSLALPAPDTS